LFNLIISFKKKRKEENPCCRISICINCFCKNFREANKKHKILKENEQNMADTGFASHIVFFVCFTLKNMS